MKQTRAASAMSANVQKYHWMCVLVFHRAGRNLLQPRYIPRGKVKQIGGNDCKQCTTDMRWRLV